jgi:hypothetical protein
VPHPTDLDLTAKDVAELASPDAISAFLAKLGYDTSDRALLSPEPSARKFPTFGAFRPDPFLVNYPPPLALAQ